MGEEMTTAERTARRQRLVAVNQLIVTISECGRRFFRHKRAIASMEMDQRGKLWWHDEYSKARIYMHRPWLHHGFNHGGGLNEFARALRDYVMTGEQLGPWGKYWGYPDEDMAKVLTRARELGILKPETANQPQGNP